MMTKFPKRWDEIKYFVCTQDFVTHTLLQTKFNIRYVHSRKIIHALQNEKIIMESDAQGRYKVLIKIYIADQKSTRVL